MRAASEVERLVELATRQLQPRQLRGFLVSLGEDGARAAKASDRDLKERAASFIRLHLTSSQAHRYADELSRRHRRGIPLVKPELLPARGSTNRYVGPPRNADEVERSERGRVRGSAVKRHRGNQKTERYRRLRSQRLTIAQHRCEACGAGGALQLHHLHYETLGRESVDDVRMLCDPCHGQETSRQRAIQRARWRSWRGGIQLRG